MEHQNATAIHHHNADAPESVRSPHPEDLLQTFTSRLGPLYELVLHMAEGKHPPEVKVLVDSVWVLLVEDLPRLKEDVRKFMDSLEGAPSEEVIRAVP